MVRKIKTQKKNKEHINIKLPKLSMTELIKKNNEIDKQLNKAIELVEKNMGKLYSEKINYLTFPTAREEFLERAVMILKEIYVNYVTKKAISNKLEGIDVESITKEEKDVIIKFIKLYEENYVPRITTIFYINFFNINKMLEKYFNKNYFKKRFSSKNTGILNIKEYKNISSGIRIKHIEKPDTVFTGEWEFQIDKIFKDLDYILNILNEYRERYIPVKQLNKEYQKTRNSFNTKIDEPVKLTKKEFKYLNKIFKCNKEIIDSYNLSITEKYKTEYDTIIECMTYVALNSDKENLKYLENAIYDISASKQKTKIILTQIKQVTTNIHIFLRNFEKLVYDGDDTFDLTIKKAELNVV